MDSLKTKRPSETICAIATAPGRGGIGVVRLSGTDLKPFALAILGKVPQARYATLAHFLDQEGESIDKGIALYFPAPHSYTGEDVLEFQGHGGPVVLQMLLQRCLQLGAKLAQAGEFTRRAFLNDQIDLAQAEAVADLIEASTTLAARSAMRSLSGNFSFHINKLVEVLIDLRMLIEATLNFPEEGIDFLHRAGIDGRLETLSHQLAEVRMKARQGSLLRTGLRVVLAGQPNVGKSSLLNCLAGEDRAIVTAIPGTTRDALRETIQIEGIPLHIIDTAGLRDTLDEVEQMGIARTWREIKEADAVILMVDAQTGFSDADRVIDRQLQHAMQGVERITVFNKVDLSHQAAVRSENEHGVCLSLSAKTGEGVELLKHELLRIVGWQTATEDVWMARERHLLALNDASKHIQSAQTQGGQTELLAEELRLAQEALGEITGKFSADDLLGEIFSRFCIGK